MNNYRPLTSEEIEALQQNDCWAEDWTSVNVAEDFMPDFMHHVQMYGEVNIGSFTKKIEVSNGFPKHTGIRNATLHNVTIGDDCLIENIGTFINNYTIGDECYISNVATIETTEGANYGEGNVISVLNEAGDGNIILFSDLSSQLAAFMVKFADDNNFKEKLFQLIRQDVKERMPERGVIGNFVKIVNTKEISNSIINDYCEINGAERLSDCTLLGDIKSNVYIGTGVIVENSIVDYDASITDGANVKSCFVGEACLINNGFSATSSVFFANSEMSNGEACAAFCGPFSASHHKSSLLIGCQVSFYNAGSATNFSNHAYKMGPIHYGILNRGTKTASGSYIFMPAQIGAYSVCLGKIMNHPDTTIFPFSYVIGEGDKTILIPGKNLMTIGFYRDIMKWPNRDTRHAEHRKTFINYDWLSPFIAHMLVAGAQTLQTLKELNGEDCKEYHFHGLCIPNKALKNGIGYYNAALKMFISKSLFQSQKHGVCDDEHKPFVETNKEDIESWEDLGGLQMPSSAEEELVMELLDDKFENIQAINKKFENIHNNYQDYCYPVAYNIIRALYDVEDITAELEEEVKEEAKQIKKEWLTLIKQDIEKEYCLGDVDNDTYTKYITRIDKQLGE